MPANMTTIPSRGDWRESDYTKIPQESKEVLRLDRRHIRPVRDRFENQNAYATVPDLSLDHWVQDIGATLATQRGEVTAAKKELDSIRAEGNVALRASKSADEPVDEEIVTALVDALQLSGVYSAVQNKLADLPVPETWKDAANSCTRLRRSVDVYLRPRLGEFEGTLTRLTESVEKSSEDLEAGISSIQELQSLRKEVARLRQVEQEKISLDEKFGNLKEAHSSLVEKNLLLESDLTRAKDEKSDACSARDSWAESYQACKKELVSTQHKCQDLEKANQSLSSSSADAIDELERDLKIARSANASNGLELASLRDFRQLVLQMLTGLVGVTLYQTREGWFKDISSSYRRLNSAPLVAPAMSTLTIQGLADHSNAQPSLLLQLYLRGGRLTLGDVDAIAGSLCGNSSAILSILVALIRKRTQIRRAFQVSGAFVICRCLKLMCMSRVPTEMVRYLWVSAKSLLSSARAASLLVEAVARWLDGFLGGKESALAACLTEVGAGRGCLVRVGRLVLVPLSPDIICVDGSSIHVVRREDLSFAENSDRVTLMMRNYPRQSQETPVEWNSDADAFLALPVLLGADYSNVGEPVEHSLWFDEY